MKFLPAILATLCLFSILGKIASKAFDPQVQTTRNEYSIHNDSSINNQIFVKNAQGPKTGFKPKIICYYTSLTQLAPDAGKFHPEDIDSDVCTHIIYAYVGKTIDTLTPVLDNDLRTFEKLIELKSKNSDLKVLLAVEDDSPREPFHTLYENSTARRRFINSSVEFINKYEFDGLEIKSSGILDSKQFTTLIHDFKEAFNSSGLLLSASLSARKDVIDDSYEVDKISKYLDWITVLTADFHEEKDLKTGSNAPLYPQLDNLTDDVELNVDWAVKYWLSKGAPAKKLIIKVPIYGKTFKLFSPQGNTIGVKTVIGATMGTFTTESGFLSYYEICEKLDNGWKREWDEQQKVPYAYNGDQWVGYEDTESLKFKIDYVKNNSLGGVMLWALDYDDYNGRFCLNGTFPMAKYAMSAFYPEKKQIFNEGNTLKSSNKTVDCYNDGFLTVSGACRCQNGYSGSMCELYHGCKGKGVFYCKNNGICDFVTGTCKCGEGYSGINCETCIQCNTTKNLICGENRFFSRTGTCKCAYGYLGTNCETFGGCAKDAFYSCKNGGYCRSYGECKCSGGYSGTYCETFLGCKLNGTFTCKNDAICTNEGFCQCLRGYTGISCEKIILDI